MAARPKPFNVEALLSSVVAALQIKGDSRAIAAVVEGEAELLLWDHDFGVNYWRLNLGIPIQLYYALSDAERESAEESILEVARHLFGSLAEDALNRVVLSPQVRDVTEDWRGEALKFIKGEGVTNQGRVRSDNIASKEHRGLLFRSKAEIVLFDALVRAKLAVSPLPVFVRVGKSYNRLEPDFLIIYKGLTFVVEVDGDTYHRETPVEADKRLVPLTYEGVEVRRIRAEDLNSDMAADAAVRDLMQFMAKRKESR